MTHVIEFCCFTHKWEEDHEGCSKFHYSPTCHLCYVNCVNIFCQCSWSSSWTPKTCQYTTETLQCNSTAHNSWGWRPQINSKRWTMISSNLQNGHTIHINSFEALKVTLHIDDKGFIKRFMTVIWTATSNFWCLLWPWMRVYQPYLTEILRNIKDPDVATTAI